MTLNYAFGFSIFLVIFVGLNVYFFYTLNTVGRRTANINVPDVKPDFGPNVFKDIYHYLNYLHNQYKNKNPEFATVQTDLLRSFNASNNNINVKDIWLDTKQWSSEESLFPQQNGAAGKILQAMRTSQIVLVDNAPKGTQLKLLLVLEGNQKLYFKPKRYKLSTVINGNIYAGFDRYNSEVFAYYLATVMNFKWIAPSVIRKINLYQEVIPVASLGLKKTTVKYGNGTVCVYGKCFYCRKNETVCPDEKGDIEGAAILYLDKSFQIHQSPWRRSYNSKKMDWEIDNDFCKKLVTGISTKRILNLVDIAIFDFLIQNGDRHRYEVYKDKILFMDNGKGLGNPTVDELDILAPLYQCCMMSMSTWKHLKMLTGGSLTETIKLLSSFQGYVLATEDHFKAVERRLLKVFATVQYCIGKHGSAKVFKDDF